MLGLGGWRLGGHSRFVGAAVRSEQNGEFRACRGAMPRRKPMAAIRAGRPRMFRGSPNNPVAVTDFSHRAIREMTVLGKQVVASYYGRAPTKNYYHGCSTGGRMGMMETQRYPDDYDAVIAGAPVYTLLVQTKQRRARPDLQGTGRAIPCRAVEARERGGAISL